MMMMTYLSITLVCLLPLALTDSSSSRICTLPGEVDICPEGMLCQLDGSGHPYCHVPGAPVPSSHCLTEDEYEPYILRDTEDMTSYEQCDQFDKSCPEPFICCRTHHGHRCFPKVKATLMQDDYEGYMKK